MNWVRIRSWHIVRLTYRGGAVGTLCGRMVKEPTLADNFPAEERTCEACLRIHARAEAKA